MPIISRLPSVPLDAAGHAEARLDPKPRPAPKLQQHLERISALPGPRQRAVMDVIEALLAQQARCRIGMNVIVFEHVKVEELPQAWRARLAQSSSTRATVRIEEEDEAQPAARAAEGFTTDDPAFGIWRDREDIDDVADHVRRIRAPRFNRDGSRNDGS